MHLNNAKKLVITLLKFGISAAILFYLIRQAQRHQSFASLRDQPKNWSVLALAWLLALAGVLVTFGRWFMLVRALEMPFKVKDALRLGFLGYLFNFVSVGSVGGDLFKAVCIAREQHGRRVEAVASVVIDRVIGMYSLLLVASAGIFISGLYRAADSPQMNLICRATLAATAIGTVGIAVLLIPVVSSPYTAHLVGRTPVIGGVLRSVLGAIRMYRDKLGVLFLVCILGLVSQTMFTVTVYLIACGLPGDHPSLLQHFVIVPLGMAAGVLPLPLGALGAFEYVIDSLYRVISGSEQGLVVALGYRLITVAIAMVGAAYYALSRREISAALHEAEALAASPDFEQ